MVVILILFMTGFEEALSSKLGVGALAKEQMKAKTVKTPVNATAKNTNTATASGSKDKTKVEAKQQTATNAKSWSKETDAKSKEPNAAEKTQQKKDASKDSKSTQSTSQPQFQCPNPMSESADTIQKSAPSQPRDPWNPLVNYNPQIGLGMRTKRHFFPDGEELVFLDGQPHTTESYHRRYHQHIFKDHYLLLTGNIDTKIHEMYSVQDPGKTKYRAENGSQDVDVETHMYIWHQYYEPRWDTGHVGSSKDRAVNQRRDETKHEEWSDEKTRENSIISFANGWTQSVDLPVDVFEEDEKVQIVETMLEKIALKHHNNNFQHFRRIFGQELVMGPDFAKYFFTIDPAESSGHAVTQLGGIIYGVKATDIETLKPKQDGQQFFENQVSITPNKIIISQMQQLTVQRETFEIKNTANKANFTIYDIMPSSPEILVLCEDGLQFNQPVRLKPGESLRLQVLIIPETLELIEAAIFVAFNPRRVFMLPVSVYVVSNSFGLKPMYYANVNLFETVKTKIEVYNPMDEPLILAEAYSTEGFVTLAWPNGKEINAQDTHNKDYTSYLTIPPKKSRTVLVAEFSARVLVDHHSLIHLMFESGHIMRMPLYYHVYADLLKFLPSIVDFGIVPLNFDAIRIPVTLKIRKHANIRMLHLTEVMLPLNDVRLDFVMGEWDRDPTHHTKVFNKNTKRLEEHRQGVIYADHEFHLMTVVLLPHKYGMINTMIKITCTSETGQEHKIELPVIGFIAPMQKLVLERTGNNFYHHLKPESHAKNPFFGFLPAEALNQANVRKFMDNNERYKALRESDLMKRFRVKLGPKEVQIPVNVYGNFRQIATGSIEVINPHADIKFEYFLPKYSSVASMETKQLGQFVLDYQNFNIGNMRKYFWIAASHSLFPQYIQFSDNRLICTVQDEMMNGKQKYSYCDDNIYLDYGQIGLYQSKHKVINVTNVGQECVLIDWVTKSNKDDEMAVSYTTNYDEHSVIYKELEPVSFDNSESNEFLNRYVNEVKVGVFVLPGKTVTLKFSLEGVIGSLKGGQAGDPKNHQIIIQCMPHQYRPFSVNYKYQVLPGGLSLTENEVKFNAGFVGLDQHRVVNMKSDFQVPLEVLSVTSSDPRIIPVIKKTVIDASSEQPIIDLYFNPGLSTKPSHSLPTSTLRRDQSEHLKNSQTSSWKLNDLHIANLKQVVSEALQAVTDDDVALWRNYMSQSVTPSTWIEGNWISGVIEDIHAVVTVKTNVVGSIEIPVSAYVTKPKILKERFIDFGGVQVGSYKTHTLGLQNPFNETLYVNLFIGRNTIEANSEIERLNNYQRHRGQLEILPHAKGTKYERELISEIQERLDQTEQMNQHQQKLALLPDIQKFCKSVRSKIAEHTSPSMQDWPESGLGTSSQNLKYNITEDGFIEELDYNLRIESGKPYDIFLRNANDLELCDLIHSTMTIMPASFFESSSWQTINSYFAKRHLENLELEAITNYQKVKEQNHMKLDPSDSESLKEHLIYKLQEQLRSMYPDSLKIADDVDREIAKDINKSSHKKPLTWDPLTNYSHLLDQLAFPSVFRNGWIGSIMRIFSPSTIIVPAKLVSTWGSDVLSTNSWGETGYKVFASMKSTFSSVLYSGLKPRGHQASTYVSGSYIDKQGRFKNVSPAPAISRQWELKSSQLHQEILQNNGTVGVQVYGQNFYINPDYQGVTYEIKPGENLVLEDAIVFEPRTFTSSQNQMQMTLYVKSEKAVLQTLPLKGWASSSVLDVTQISKSVFFTNNAADNSTSILAQYSQNCMQRLTQLKKSDPEEFKTDGECLDALKSLELVKNQTLGKSTLPQVINLYVHESDVMNTNVESLDRNLFYRLLNPFEKLSSKQMHIDTMKEIQINQVILWELSVMNVGEIDFAVISVYLEDPLTGERSCFQDGLRLWPCIDSRINALKTKTFSLQYVSDFSVSEIRKTLVLESLDVIQRFPIQIDISAKALRVAAEYVSDDIQLQRPVFGAISHDILQLLYSVMMGTALWITYSLFQMYHGEDETQKGINAANQLQSFVSKPSLHKSGKALDSVQNVLATVTPTYIQNQYVQTQDRFRQHSSIFLRECVNLTQRKNSITIEYQRGLAARLGKQQAFMHAKAGRGQVYKTSNAPQPHQVQSSSFIGGGVKDETEPSFSAIDETGNSSQIMEATMRSSDAERRHADESDNDAAHTDELLQQAFVTTRKGNNRHQQQKNQHSQYQFQLQNQKASTKAGNYSVDFESQLHMEAATARELDETASAEGGLTFQKVGKSKRRDDSFTLVGQKEDISPLQSQHSAELEEPCEREHSPRQKSAERGPVEQDQSQTSSFKQAFKKSTGLELLSASVLKPSLDVKGEEPPQTRGGEADEEPGESKQSDSVADAIFSGRDDAKAPEEITATSLISIPEIASGVGAGHQRSKSNLVGTTSVIAAAATTNKKRKLTKQEESALKKRKAKYDQIQKQMKKKQELEAAAFEQAKKEREQRKKQEEEERKKQELLEKERRMAQQKELAISLKAKELQEQQDQAEKASIDTADRAETTHPDEKESDQNESHEEASSKKDSLDELQVPDSRQSEKEVEPEDEASGAEEEQTRGGAGNQSSFEAEQPQNFSQKDASDSVTPKNQSVSHRRNISWGRSDQHTVNQDSEDTLNRSEETYNSIRSVEQISSQDKPHQTYTQRGTGKQSTRSIFQREQSPQRMTDYAPPARNQRGTAYQSRRSQQTQQTSSIQKQYIAKQYQAYQPSQKHAESLDQFNNYSTGGSSGQRGQTNYHSIAHQYEDVESTAQVHPTQQRYHPKGNRTVTQQLKSSQSAHWRQQQQSEQSDDDYRESGYYMRGGRVATGEQQHPYHSGSARQQTKRLEQQQTYDGSEYDHQIYGTKPRRSTNAATPLDRDYYGQTSSGGRAALYSESVGGRGGAGQSSIYQERMRPASFYAGQGPQQVAYSGNKRGQETLSRRNKYQESQAQSEYHQAYYGSGQSSSLFSRGEPYQSPAYGSGPKGRSRFQDRYFHDEESYYGEQDYEQEEDDYGEEMDATPMQKYRQKDYAGAGRSKPAYLNEQFFRKKQQDMQQKNPQSSGQAPQQNSYTQGGYSDSYASQGDAYEGEEDYALDEQHQKHHRRFSRKEYEMRQQQQSMLPDMHSNYQNIRYGQEERSYREKQTRIDGDLNLNKGANAQRVGYATQAQQQAQRYMPQQHQTQGHAQVQRPANSKAQSHVPVGQSVGQPQYYDKQQPAGGWQDPNSGLPSTDQHHLYVEHSANAMQTQGQTPMGAASVGQSQGRWNPNLTQGKKKLNYLMRDQQTVIKQGSAQVQSETRMGLMMGDQQARTQRVPANQAKEVNPMQALPTKQGDDVALHKHPQPPVEVSNLQQVSKKLEAQQHEPAQARPAATKTYLDSDEDEDDLLKSSGKHYLKTPGSRSSRRQSFDDYQDEDEEESSALFSAPKPSKNFFSIFKQIQPIFSRNQEVPNAFDPENDEPGSAQLPKNSSQGGGSLFAGSSNLNLFGGLHHFDNYNMRGAEQERRPNPQNSLFGANSFFDQSAGQQDLHSFNPQQQEQQESEMQQQKQPSSLEALRMSSRPLQMSQARFGDDPSGASPHGQGSAAQQQHQQQMLFSRGLSGGQGEQRDESGVGFQWKKLEPYKPSKLPSFAEQRQQR